MNHIYQSSAILAAGWSSSMIVGTCLQCNNVFRKRENKYKYCSVTCANRFNKNNFRQFIVPPHSKLLAELIGICLGDGYAGKYQTTITLNATADSLYTPYVISLIKKLYPSVHVSIVDRSKYGAIDINLNSKVVCDQMKQNGIISKDKQLPNWILQNDEYIKSCIKGLFDTEGSISFKIYHSSKKVSLYKQLNFRNYNPTLMMFVRDSLVKFGFNPTQTLKKSLYLSNESAIQKYQELIGFANPKLNQRASIKTYEDYKSKILSV